MECVHYLRKTIWYGDKKNEKLYNKLTIFLIIHQNTTPIVYFDKYIRIY